MISTISSSSDGNEDRNIERGFDLNGKTMGIMGLGAIGKGLAKFANGAGMRVIGYDPFWNDEWANANNVAQVDVDTIFKESDVVSLHVPYLPENHHIVNDERLSQMKQGAVLINTARGELVDTIALLKHVTSSHLGGVGADVIEEEDILVNDNLTQLILNSDSNDDKTAARLKIVSAIAALQKMPNVIITNHNAFNTKEALQLINDMTLENITGFITGGKIYSVK
jgi:D-lactate dehydrogenase